MSKPIGRPPGIPNPNAGRPALPPGKRKVFRTVRLDPDVSRLITWHANARGNTFNASLNQLLGEALKQHEIDEEAKEVL